MTPSTPPSLGLRKQGKFSHLCKLLDKHGIKYSVKDIEELSTSQMRKQIKELKGSTIGKENCWEARGRMSDDY